MLPTTEVSGVGSISNPWKFIEKYKVSTWCNSSYGKINDDLIKYVDKNNSVSFKYTSKEGYDYDTNNCNARELNKVNNSTTVNGEIGLSNINSDMSCEIIFKPRIFEVTLNNISNNTYIYYEYKIDKYYSNLDITNAINKVKIVDRTGYIFKGYYNSSDVQYINSNGEIVKDIYSILGNQQYTSKWTPVTYTIEYNSNGGYGSMDSTVHTYDVASSLRTNTFLRTDYVFLGWSTDKNATTATYSNNQSISNLSSVNGSVVRLFAVWRPIIYSCSAGTLENDAKFGHICVGYSGITASNTYPYQSCYNYSYQGKCEEKYNATCYRNESGVCGSEYVKCKFIKGTCWDCYKMSGTCSGASCYCVNCCCSSSSLQCEKIDGTYPCTKSVPYSCQKTKEVSCTKYAQSCDTYYATNYYCPSGWNNYSGSESNLICYKAADAN